MNHLWCLNLGTWWEFFFIKQWEKKGKGERSKLFSTCLVLDENLWLTGTALCRNILWVDQQASTDCWTCNWQRWFSAEWRRNNPSTLINMEGQTSYIRIPAIGARNLLSFSFPSSQIKLWELISSSIQITLL